MKDLNNKLTYSQEHWDAVDNSIKTIAIEAFDNEYMNQATVSNLYGLVRDALDENNIDLETVSPYAFDFLASSLIEALSNAKAIKASRVYITQDGDFE